MNKEERTILEKRLACLDSNEKNRLYKRAAQLRKLAQAKNNTRPKRAYFIPDEDEEPEEIGIRQPKASLHDWVLKLLKQEEAPLAAAEPESTLPKGTVISLATRSAEVLYQGRLLPCILTGEIADQQQTEIAVGDDVEIVIKGETALVERVLPRRTRLSRPDPVNRHRERVIVANVDIVVVVASLVSPPLHPRLLDRYLIAIRRGGAQAVIAINKVDLADDLMRHAELAKLEPYRGLGVPLVPVSAEQGLGLDELRHELTGKLSAFVGHSGVGKSSLLNAMRPDLGLEVGSVSEGYGRGTHTTTRSTLWDLGDGTKIIDTPGIRSFGLWNLSREELPWYFPEFAVGGCKFRDCSHLHEPGCAVKDAISRGEISPERYDTYLRVLESL